MSRRQLANRGHTRFRGARLCPTTLTNTPQDKAMLRKRRLVNSSAPGSDPDPSRCEQSQHFPYDQLSNDPVAPSKEAESRRYHEDSPRCCERVHRLVWPPQVRPRRCECTRQALRGIGRVDGCRAQLMRMVAGIQRRQGEDRRSYTPARKAQPGHHHNND